MFQAMQMVDTTWMMHAFQITVGVCGAHAVQALVTKAWRRWRRR